MTRYWACWKLKPRDPAISPCGYKGRASDPACRGCADDPRTARDAELDEAVEKTAKNWAKRWNIR